MNEWVEHKGKRRPVHRDELVNVIFRGGKANLNISVNAEDLDWVHRGDSADIVAYRVHSPSKDKQIEAV